MVCAWQFLDDRHAGGEPSADLLDRRLDPQGYLMLVAGRGEPGQHVLRRVEPLGWLERARTRPHVRDAVEAEGPVLADAGIHARHVPAARMGDEPVRVQGALATSAVAGGVSDPDWLAMTHGVGEREQDPGLRRGRLTAGLTLRSREGKGAEQGVEPAAEPLGQHPPDLSRRRLARRVSGRQQAGLAAGRQAEQHR